MAEKNEKLPVVPFSENPEKCILYLTECKRYENLKLISEKLVSNTAGAIRFVCISDTHGKHNRMPNLPNGDVLIHSGDFSMFSHKDELESFNNYLGSLKNTFKHIVVIAGNHELSFDERKWNKSSLVLSIAKTYYLGSPFASMLSPEESKKILTNCVYLQDDYVIIDGIKIYGSPWQPPHFDLAFCSTRGNEIMEKWNNIPSDTDILITHGPPLGIGDKLKSNYHVGCADLLVTVQDRVKPKFHIFGHIHESHGVWSDGTTTFVNATICDSKYMPVQSPIVFDYSFNKRL